MNKSPFEAHQQLTNERDSSAGSFRPTACNSSSPRTVGYAGKLPARIGKGCFHPRVGGAGPGRKIATTNTLESTPTLTALANTATTPSPRLLTNTCDPEDATNSSRPRGRQSLYLMTIINSTISSSLPSHIPRRVLTKPHGLRGRGETV